MTGAWKGGEGLSVDVASFETKTSQSRFYIGTTHSEVSIILQLQGLNWITIERHN